MSKNVNDYLRSKSKASTSQSRYGLPQQSQSQSQRRPPDKPPQKNFHPFFENGTCPKNSDARAPTNAFSSEKFREFLFDQAAAARTRDSRFKAEYFQKEMAAAKVKSLLEHHMAMMRLTRQMNKLLGDISLCKESLVNQPPKNKGGKNSGKARTSPIISPLEESRSTRTGKGKKGKKSGTKGKKMKESNDYVIFSGGPTGLEYTSLRKTESGTFRMEIDVSKFEPEDLQISTLDRKTMHVKASRLGVRKTLKLVSPLGVDIDDVIIHYPKRGVLLLEAP